ncbi:MAG: hypothetical protein EAY75_01035 [Bacteroidetes bacterium]|nr:MAG: hypothetical protein EAY75_01035 [Bacteroidota bacterium]
MAKKTASKTIKKQNKHMTRRIILLLCLGITLGRLQAQELYIFTEPASNMAANSIGLRLNTEAMPMRHGKALAYRLNPEVMWGVNKNFMVHAGAYMGDMFQPQWRFEGASLYAKYRFLSLDDVHKHFRMAAFGRLAISRNPAQLHYTTTHLQTNTDGTTVVHTLHKKLQADELALNGNNSGAQVGVVATQLLHKLALSTSAGYIMRMNNVNAKPIGNATDGNWQATLSAGYLLLPKTYRSYKQTNLNLYCEALAQKATGGAGYFVDVAPGIQFIFNSISRLDLGYRFQAAGNMSRYNSKLVLLRFEYNFFNVRQPKAS